MRFYARTSPNTGVSVGWFGMVLALLWLPLVFVAVVLLVVVEELFRAGAWAWKQIRG